MLYKKISTIHYLWFFIFSIVVIIVSSIVGRVVNEAKTSTFRNNSFSLLIVSKDSKLIYVDRERKKALFLALGNIESYVKGKNTLEATFSLGVPINGIINVDKAPINIDDFVNQNGILNLLLSDQKYKNLNKYDIFKLVSFLGGISKENKKEVRVDLFNINTIRELDGDFEDSVIRNSQLTVEIDNGTHINGLGNLMALILTKQGYNVIAVRTTQSKLSSFIAFEGTKNQITDSLTSLTGFKIKSEKVSEEADVIVFLGEDVDAMLSP